MQLLLSKYKKNLRDLRAELRTKEKVLEGIAMELHDNVTQLLTAANLSLELANKPGIHTGPAELTAQSQRFIAESIDRIRQLSHSIVIDVPAYSFDLNTEIQNLKAFFPPQIHCELTFKCTGSHNIRNKHLSMHIFRIVQELLANVKKHAGATKVDVLVRTVQDSVEIRVADDGTGFSEAEEKAKKGIGLQNIRQRVKLCGGTIQVRSIPGSGTTVHITLPLSKKS